jgi:hypothetical protein
VGVHLPAGRLYRLHLTHLGFFTGLGEVFVPVLAVLWLLVTVRTAHSVWRGELLGKVPALPTTGLPHV